MVATFQDLWLVAGGVVFGAFLLTLAAITHEFPQFRWGRPPASRGHRPPEQEAAHQEQKGETVSPDGYIDTFAGVTGEAGGGVPMMVWVVLIGAGIWYLLYLILFWNG